MTSPPGRAPLRRARLRTDGARPADAFTVSPFSRLARTHAFSTGADAMVATALAGTIFFEGATSQARSKVFLYLILTMAPFAVVAPLIGPVLDRVRSGRRWMLIGTIAGRSLLTALMVNDTKSLLLYPEAFLILVLQKSYVVARAALVPATVSQADLVEANSKLQLLSGLMSFAGAAPAGLLFKIGGPGWSLIGASLTFAAGTVVGLRLPKTAVAAGPEGAEARSELRSGGVLLAASAMGLIRGTVGYLTLFLAFYFRRGAVPKWQLAVVGGVSMLGTLLGALVAPGARKHASEERMLTVVLALIVVAGVMALAAGGYPGAAIVGFAVGIGSVAGKQAFDSIVQRDAPDANRGRSFARFETQFQIIWVLGALLGLVFLPLRVGFTLVVVTNAFAAFSYGVGSLAFRYRSGQRTPVTERAAAIDERLSEVQEAARRRAARSARALWARARGSIASAAARRGSRRPPGRPPEQGGGGGIPPSTLPGAPMPRGPMPGGPVPGGLVPGGLVPGGPVPGAPMPGPWSPGEPAGDCTVEVPTAEVPTAEVPTAPWSDRPAAPEWPDRPDRPTG